MLRISDIWHRYNLSHKAFNAFACLTLFSFSVANFHSAFKVATTDEKDLKLVRLRRQSYYRQFSDFAKYQSMSEKEKIEYLTQKIEHDKEIEELER